MFATTPNSSCAPRLGALGKVCLVTDQILGQDPVFFTESGYILEYSKLRFGTDLEVDEERLESGNFAI